MCTLMCGFIMKHLKFTAAESIAWAPMCRPGSVNDLHQKWLEMKTTLSLKTCAVDVHVHAYVLLYIGTFKVFCHEIQSSGPYEPDHSQPGSVNELEQEWFEMEITLS